MKLLTNRQRQELLARGRVNAERQSRGLEPVDLYPSIKLFTPDGAATWLLTELDDDGIAFGLCDLGVGFPEIGSVSLAELRDLRGKLGLPVERDRHFKPRYSLTEYAERAEREGRIIA